MLVTFLLRKRKEKKAKVRQYANSNENDYQFDVVLILLCTDFVTCVLERVEFYSRWRASQLAGLKAIPAYIKTTDDKLTMEMALVENIQREDLNAIEIALAYQRLSESTGMTQERMSERLGKSRTSITNYMRLLKLPAQIQMALKNRDIDMGHARALLSLESPSAQLKLFKDVHRNGYSVRKVEEMVQMVKNGDTLQNARKTVAPNQLPLEYSILRDRLSDLFKTKVQMTCSAQSKGRISISFANEDELEYIMNVFDKLKKK